MKLHNNSANKVVDFSDADLYPLIGNSACIQELRNAIKKYARCDAEVLIQGETGVGKGLCARLIHQLSRRRESPFIEVNCGAIPSGLIASELFGHEKGAFTGAIADRIGFIQKAHKGTLFLDEIGDMPPDLQIHLLHFLESKQIHKVGADKFIDVDCRVIAASHVDLKSEVVQGEFREDLFYRLNILPLTIPPLRKRGRDILMLSEHFLNSLSNGQVNKMSADVEEMLLKHRWPGNVRELRNVIQRAIIMCDDNTLLVEDLGLDCNERQLLPSVDQIDLDYLLQAIEENKHNMSAAARDLGISRTTLYRLIKKYNLSV
ncbi:MULTISPECIES: sigma-54 interaction domain-containing protein [Vibrio]|uniref:Sigma-54-dependent Fis family transcriptional regulator n=1 Tax=Vibrio natriegens NBRC 15636 = ATCC 14048 = DSM 759 TaxID=1219067 RepID=A0AAN0Y1I5_VIBNA|nr:sigma-54 dependent transcriptional regulator [Vibrio natriegens]MEE3878264.1 sigma-54 dependent transcriptional regulator [Vibrio sp. YYF0003]ANQ12240.1 sigma-54-dependent Fis family transcriptional regulator [Vibrio natriegens NBRC 15636 = ATCC 14048 = DSM 759]ANQ21264.1 sigma-54-dependent Fis family transcriptional regulator [Vibrio natriegens]ANQ26055.1 sigma-54-dependent Fis family transcriptional regulator [Vibrio natriegens]EPM42725.1 ATPase AAA [Vibrio natriegens NBRC 15636 = ATCC 14